MWSSPYSLHIPFFFFCSFQLFGKREPWIFTLLMRSPFLFLLSVLFVCIAVLSVTTIFHFSIHANTSIYICISSTILKKKKKTFFALSMRCSLSYCVLCKRIFRAIHFFFSNLQHLFYFHLLSVTGTLEYWESYATKFQVQ